MNRDILFLIANAADDITSLNILISNKKLIKYLNSFFDKRHPHLIGYNNEKFFYIKILKYIHWLQRDFGINYKYSNFFTSMSYINPILIYGFNKYRAINLNYLLELSSANGDLELVKTIMQEKIDIVYIDTALKKAHLNGHLNVVKYFCDEAPV